MSCIEEHNQTAIQVIYLYSSVEQGLTSAHCLVQWWPLCVVWFHERF